MVNNIVYSNITNGQYVYFVSDGTYWTASQTNSSVSSGTLSANTIEPTGDTSAGDNAAIGYTASEGLILTGQGSTNDVTLKNDDDETVISIPTGTTNATFSGNVGIRTSTPGTLLQLEGTEPYLTLKNSTSENTDGGCESKIIFKIIQIHICTNPINHDGSANDTKGDLISTHNGSNCGKQ